MSCFLALFLATFLLGINITLAHNTTARETDTDKNIIVTEVRKKFPYTLSGHDEDGAPIWLIEVGKFDYRKYVDMGGIVPSILSNHLDKMFDNIQESAINSKAKEAVIIGDFEGFDNRQMSLPTINFMLRIAARVTKIFDGHLKKIYFVNANYIFKSFWQLVKPFFGSVASIVELYGTNKEDWIPRILKELPKEELPQWYGGSKDHRPLKIYS